MTTPKERMLLTRRAEELRKTGDPMDADLAGTIENYVELRKKNAQPIPVKEGERTRQTPKERFQKLA